MKIGAALVEGHELMHRQVHPSFILEDRPTSQAFRVTPKDKGMLSVNRGSMVEPQQAFNNYVARADCSSVGVVAVTVDECKSVELPVLEAPLSVAHVEDPDDVDDDTHAVIDITKASKSGAIKKSQKLQVAAVERGWLYRR